MAIGIAIGIASVASSLMGASSAKKKAGKLGRAQARLERETTAEEIRRMDRDFDQLKGLATASVAASGLQMEGSPKDFIADMESEFGRQKSWTERAGEMRADVARRGGAASAQQIGASGIQGALGGIQQIGTSADWWS